MQPGRIYKQAAQTRTGRQSSLAERSMPWQERYTNRQDVQAGTSPAKQPEHVQRLHRQAERTIRQAKGQHGR